MVDERRKGHHGTKLLNVGLLALICLALLWLGVNELRRGSWLVGGVVLVLAAALAVATGGLFARYWRR